MYEYKVAEIDWLQHLRQKNILKSNALQFLEFCVSKGGYVSGGFARVLTNYFLGLNNNDVNSSHIRWYVDCYRNNDTKSLHGGDIDVFFPNAETAEKIRLQALTGSFQPSIYRDTPAKFGHEFIFDSNIIQLISKVNGNPQDVMQSFDITNAKVFLDKDGIHWFDEWVVLEQNRQLGIDIYDKVNLLWRIRKWKSKHGYRSLREGDHSKFVDALFLTAEKVNNQSLKRFSKPVGISEIKRFCKFFMHTAPPTIDLIKVSLLLDSYDQIQILKHLNEIG